MRAQMLAGLTGLISEEVGNRLAELARDVPRSLAIVELGSFKGKSTAYLAEGARLGHHAHVWAVDPWDLPGNPSGRHGFASFGVMEKFYEQLGSMSLLEGVSAIREFSTVFASFWKGPQVGLLYIDGSHVYSDVKEDYEAWSPHLASGATVVFDDYDTEKNPGVKKFVDELGLPVDLDVPPLAIVRP